MADDETNKESTDDKDGERKEKPVTMEIKIVRVQVEAESPLLPNQDYNSPSDPLHNNTNISPASKASNGTSGSGSNTNNNTTSTTASSRRKSIASTISCRRRSSIPSVRLDESLNSNEDLTSVQSHPPTNLYPNDSFTVLDGKPPRHSCRMETKVDAVGKITGQWGKWQLRTVLLIFLCKIPSSWFMACIIFTAPAPRHGEFYCKPPSTIGARNHTQWIKVSHPEKEEADDQEFNIDFCNVFQDAQEHAHHYYRYDHKENEPKLWEEPLTRNSSLVPCTVFQHNADYHSLITQFDLVCSRDILVAVTQFFHLFGVLTGGILATQLLKHFSPRNVMLFGMFAQIFCGNMTGHVASYELHVFFRCLSAVSCAQMYTAGAMIFSDITGGTYRTVVVCLFEQFWSIGVIMLPGVASFFTSWTHLYMAISFPTFILIYLWRWIPDSPRWMIQRGRVLEAKEILLQCVQVNGTQHRLPHDIDQQLQLQAITAMEAPPPAGWWTIWKGDRAVRHMICVHLCWSIYIVVYYGMLLNIRSFSREHLEVNTVVAGCCEIIGTFCGLALILTTSRKWLWTGLANVLAGFVAYMAWLIPPEIQGNNRIALLMLSAMVSKAAISCTLSILTTCTTELVAEESKKICAFSTIVWARIWLLCAPFIGATVIFGTLVPQTAFASLSIIGGVLTALISSPRTIPRKQKTVTSNQFNLNNTNLNNEKLNTQTTILKNNNLTTKIAQQQTNLPPELMPGIWTTKSHDDNFRI